MRKALVGLVVAAVMLGGTAVGTSAADQPECNWGELTAEAIADDFPQGSHSSDPSGDGRGPGSADEPRSGIANVVERGNLDMTCELIKSLLP